MKAQKQLTVGIATAIIAVLVASQSVNQAAVTQRAKQEQVKIKAQGDSNEDIEFLMNANHWTRQEAIGVLNLSSKATERAGISLAPSDPNKIITR